jgi:hypothetical protein
VRNVIRDHFVAQIAKRPEYRRVSGPSRLFSTGTKKLSDEEFKAAKKMVMAYLAYHTSITNREFRALTQLNYDQAVSFFNRMIANGSLLRVGKTTSIKYLRRGARDLK